MDNFNNQFNNSNEPTVDYSQPGTFTGATAEWQSNNVQEELPTFTETVGNAYSYEAPVYEETKTNNGKVGVSIVSMITGILSLVCCPVYTFIFIWVLSLTSLITGIISLKNKYAGKGMAIAGIICSVISLLIAGFMIVTIVIGGLASGASSSSYYY